MMHRQGAGLDRKADAVEQSLDQSMSTYNWVSGLLVTRHYDAGFKMLMCAYL
jgi:hypothetical protein